MSRSAGSCDPWCVRSAKIDGVTERPRDLLLVRHREVLWILPVALCPGVLALIVWIGTELVGDSSADWSTPALGIGTIVALGVATWLVLTVWLRVNERRHAERVLAAPMAVWPQYSTTAQWAKAVDERLERLPADPLQVVGPAAVIRAAVVLIAAVAAATGDAGTSVLGGVIALGAVWVIAGVLIAVRSWFSRRAIARVGAGLHAIQPFPRCWVGEDGVYFEDTGLVRLHHLAAVDVVAPGDVPAHRTSLRKSGLATGFETDLTPLDTRLSKSGWALLALSRHSAITHTFWSKVERAFRGPSGRRMDWADVVHVRVPPDDVARARDVAARIRRRWLG